MQVQVQNVLSVPSASQCFTKTFLATDTQTVGDIAGELLDSARRVRE